jgi:hypothetical protein
MQDPDFYRDGILKLVPRWNKCIDVLGDLITNNDASVEEMSYV